MFKVSRLVSTIVRSQPEAGNAVSLKSALQQASRLVENAAYTGLSGALGRGQHASGHGMRHQRTIVTSATHDALKKIVPDRIEAAPVAPYQSYGDCETHAFNLIQHIQRSKKKQMEKPQTVTQEKPFALSGLWDKLKSGLQAKFESRPVRTADDFLHVYRDRGIFSLRGPGLANAYVDHVVTVFSVTKINTPQGEKIVLGVLDDNDIEENPETEAAWKAVKQTNKQHVSELSHEEANQCGADKRRIRFIDGDKLAKRIGDAYARLRFQGIDSIRHPEVTYPAERIPCVSPEKEEELRTLLEKIYDDEVEKFE